MVKRKKVSGGNLIDLRKSNKKEILKLLCANGSLCCSDIARKINLSVGGTANITDEMIAAGMLEKTDAEYVVRGRRPYRMRIKEQVGVVATVKKKKKITLTICDFAGKELHDIDLSYEKLTADVFSSVIELLKNYLSESGKRLYAISVGMGGKINKYTGEFIYAPSIQNSRDVNLKKMFGETFAVPVCINTNVVFEIIAEKRYNSDVDIYNTLFVDDLGCAMFINGELFTGQHGFAGELGLLDIDVYGETLAKYNKGLDEYRAHYFMSPYIGLFAKENLGPESNAEAYRRGDAETVRKFNGFFDIYSRTLRNIVEFMDFGNVIIHGEVASFGKEAIQYIENELVDSKFGRLDVKVYPSVLGADAALKGAILSAMEESFEEFVEEPLCPSK